MKEIVILSGKGGTGKTSITAAFATLAHEPVLVDCDVDAADLHLVLKPDVTEAHEFSGGKIAQIDSEKCIQCGECARLCRFSGVTRSENGVYSIDESGCEGCGVCAEFCPREAIGMVDSINGHWFSSWTRVGPMIHARLNAGGENSGKLVTLVRNEARSVAESRDRKIIITDGPPGIGCPVIASLAGASRVVIVTEPTVSGLHDLERVVKLTKHFRVPSCVIVNKASINAEKCGEIGTFASDNGIGVMGELPYDPVFTHAQLQGKSVIEHSNGPVSHQLRRIWNRLNETIS